MFVVKKGNNSEMYAEERPEFPSSEQAWFKITISLLTYYFNAYP